MRFVGMNLAIKINNTTVIATGYTMLNTGIDIEITAFKPWLAIIKLIKMKTNTNALYDTLGTILWKYSETATISPHAVVRHASATMMPNKYFPNEPILLKPLSLINMSQCFDLWISIDLTSCHLLAYDYQYNLMKYI